MTDEASTVEPSEPGTPVEAEAAPTAPVPPEAASAPTVPVPPEATASAEAGVAPAPAVPPATAPLSQDELRAAFESDEVAAPITEAPGDEGTGAPEGRQPTGRGLGTGRRKEAVARVRLVPGEGRFALNGRSLEAYFPARAHRMLVTAPLRMAGRDKDFDVIARIHGGGVSGQAGALQLGISRALIDVDGSLRPSLKAEGMLRRDAREKERRKYGLKKARKAPQYSKR